jgi:aldehyde dehydrogenase (NAD+)
MHSFLQELGIEKVNSGACGAEWISHPKGQELVSLNPSTGEPIATVMQAGAEDYERVMSDAVIAFEAWRSWPAPKRGEVVRQIGEALRQKKDALAALVSLEMGKIRAEGLGEVQEMIDICDFSTGLSRQLYGLSMHSERPGHRMYEQWHPLGVVGIISAFNFPVAVWSWNSAIAAVCGDSMIWKPSSDTPLCAVAVQKIAFDVLKRNGIAGLMGLVIGKGSEVGEKLLHDARIPLISATGSCQLGEKVLRAGAPRYLRTILELGGNNAIIVMDDADIDLAARALLFGAIGTSGQRCTTTRRLIMQKGIAPKLTERLVNAYKQIRIGDPLDTNTVMGPLVNEAGVKDMMHALEIVKQQGGEILYGGKRIDRPGFFVEPTLVKANHKMPIVAEETFAPVLYLMECDGIEDAIQMQNGVPQGLSSAIFTRNLLSAEAFLSPAGSDCGIANVNIGTSGAEIGGAFGGEKATGGGREAGSDSWKQYMRRQTCTINYTSNLPLAQGINFG